MKIQGHPHQYYYKLRMDDSDPRAIVCIERDEKGFDVYRLYKGKWIDDWPEGITFYVKGEHPEDYLLGGLGWVAISENVRQSLNKCGVTEGQFLPIQVIHKETGNKIGSYWILNVLKVVEALDPERTRWLNPHTKETDEFPTLNIIKEALRREALKGVDIFLLGIKGQITRSVYISEYLKQCLEKEKTTKGLKFIPIPVG